MQKALALLEAAFGDMGLDNLQALNMGQRDARLLDVRRQLFGARLAGLVDCPVCGAALEFNCHMDTLACASKDGSDADLTIKTDGYTISFRLPTCEDLAAVPDPYTPPDARLMLLRRCVLDARNQGHVLAFDQIPADMLDTIELRMSEAEPQADVSLAMKCEGCGHQWSAPFDIFAFTWREVETWALRTLQQVHELAMHYGWRESDILAMNPKRRQLYINLSTP